MTTMKRSSIVRGASVIVLVLAFSELDSALAHCDGLDGPVVSATRKSLETGNLKPVLIWVQEKDEPVIRDAFKNTLLVRKLSPEARKLADTYFFSTFVRIHRAGEGAPYTGLKPAGRNLGPAILAADRALETGNADSLIRPLTHTVETGIREQFEHAMARRRFDPNDVKAGRAYVARYVEFIHYVERIYGAAHSPAIGHYAEHQVAEHRE